MDASHLEVVLVFDLVFVERMGLKCWLFLQKHRVCGVGGNP